jgi:hypothetical protein
MFREIDDVVIMNQHRVSQSNYMGTYYGRYVRFGTGNTRSRSKTIGDVVFMHKGTAVMRFNQIADPQGVARLAKSVKKNVIQYLKNEEKKNKQLEREKEKKAKERPSKQGKLLGSVVVCHQCKNENQTGSQFCSSCGIKLQNICPNCGKNNPEDSAFCNNCGSKLGVQTTGIETPQSYEASIKEDNFLECVLPEYDIKINYPATWHKIDKQDLKGTLVVAFSSFKESRSDPFLETVGISVIPISTELSKSITPQACAESTFQSFKKKNSDFVLLESIATTAGGLPAQQAVFIAGGRKYLYVFTPIADKVYLIIYMSTPEKYLKFLSIVEQMIASVEFKS